MFNKFNLKLGLQVVFFLIVCFLVHFGLTLVLGLDGQWNQYDISLTGIYGFGFILTILIYFAVIGIHFSMPQSLGYVFLGLITIRGISSYLLIDRYMEVNDSSDFLKYNFLISFFVYLISDAYMAYRVLNK